MSSTRHTCRSALQPELTIPAPHHINQVAQDAAPPLVIKSEIRHFPSLSFLAPIVIIRNFVGHFPEVTYSIRVLKHFKSVQLARLVCTPHSFPVFASSATLTVIYKHAHTHSYHSGTLNQPSTGAANFSPWDLSWYHKPSAALHHPNRGSLSTLPYRVL